MVANFSRISLLQAIIWTNWVELARALDAFQGSAWMESSALMLDANYISYGTVAHFREHYLSGASWISETTLCVVWMNRVQNASYYTICRHPDYACKQVHNHLPAPGLCLQSANRYTTPCRHPDYACKQVYNHLPAPGLRPQIGIQPPAGTQTTPANRYTTTCQHPDYACKQVKNQVLVYYSYF